MEETTVTPTFNKKPGRRKMILEYVTLESGIIFILVLVIIGILFFLGVFSFGKLSNVLTGKKANHGYFDATRAAELAKKVVPSLNPEMVLDVAVASDDPKYTLSFAQKEEFVALLKEWEVFPKLVSLYKKGDASSFTLTVRLTDVSQQDYKVTNPKTGTYMSASFKENDSGVDLYVYVLPSILSADEDPESYVQAETVTALYRITFDPLTQSDVKSYDEKLTATLKGLYETKTSYFQLSKK